MVREFVCPRMTFEERDKVGKGANLGQSALNRGNDKVQVPEKEVEVE